MLFITQPEERPDGYVVLSESTQWVRWLHRNIPQELDREVRRRLISNLKHLLVGLELKAGLIYPHQLRYRAERSVLYEPYFQNLILDSASRPSRSWRVSERLTGSTRPGAMEPTDPMCAVTGG